MNLHAPAPGPQNQYGYPNLWPEDSMEHIVSNGFNIGMIQADEEALAFAAYIRDVIRSSHILELGTLCGGMFYIMDRMGKPGLRISVDMPWEERDPKPCWPPFLFQGAVPDAVWIEGNIHDDATLRCVQEAVGHRKIDLMFIDADHSYEGARKHFLMYSPLVRRGGIIAFHDVLNGWACGEYYRELCDLFPHRTFAATNCNPFGIGVIEV